MHNIEEQCILPQAFVDKMKTLLEEEWEQFEDCYQNQKYQALRFNPLKKGLKSEAYPAVLKKLDITKTEEVPWAEHGFYYGVEAHPGKHVYHEAGLYYIQEPSAMSAAALLSPKPSERVLDLCAAPGGKSTQLAGFLNQQGLLVANEIHPARCKILSQNIERLGIQNAIVTNEDSETLVKYFPEFFDKILVDAPCSGEGMFRKNPEACGEWSPENVKLCAKRQLEILENAAKMLVPGGKMVYSTCTFSPEENEGVIAAFLEQNPDFELADETCGYFDPAKPEWSNGNSDLKKAFRLWPHHLHGEGHFVAVLRKKNENTNTEEQSYPKENGNTYAGEQSFRKNKKGLDKLEKEKRSVLQEFLSQTLTKEVQDWILNGNLVLFGEQLYRLPDGITQLSGLRVLRAGLHIGTFKKNRFEPSHALALALGEQEVKNSICLESGSMEAQQYYNGESLNGEVQKGWCLICVDGYSAGWGKAAGGQIKNHYPKGLRKCVG